MSLPREKQSEGRGRGSGGRAHVRGASQRESHVSWGAEKARVQNVHVQLGELFLVLISSLPPIVPCIHFLLALVQMKTLHWLWGVLHQLPQ